MYTPDQWDVIKIETKTNKPLYKVFGSWKGGFTRGDSWQLNSGIVKVEETDTYYDFHGFSGSVYRCYKNAGAPSGYNATVLANYIDRAVSVDATITIMDRETKFSEVDYSYDD